MKSLTLDQSLSQIYAAPQQKAKISFPAAWQKVLPFILMLETFFPKYSKEIDAVIAGVNAWIAGAKAAPVKFIAAWTKIKPFLSLLKMFGKKVWVWVNAVIVGIDTWVGTEE